MTNKHTFKEHVLRVIAVVGLIAVLLLGAWGIIQLAFFIPDFLSGVASGIHNNTAAKETLVVSMPLAATSGSSVPVSWTHKNGSGQYGYSISYSCAAGVSVKAPLPNNTLQTVPCDTPFNYTNAGATMPLTFVNTSGKSASVTVTVTAAKLSTGAITATGAANTSIAPATKKTATKTSAKASTSYVAARRTTALYGTPDLQVRIISNPGTVSAGTQIPLQFEIANIGTNVVAANWNFTANLPYSGGYTYQSPNQQALYPGDKIVYTLSYTAIPQNQQNGGVVCTQQYPNYNCGTPTNYPYDPNNISWSNPGTFSYNYNSGYQYSGYGTTQTASVTADPYNLIWETNEGNNTASVTYQVY